MTSERKYPLEVLDPGDDNGTMPESLDDLEKAVVGHKIVDVRYGSFQKPNYWGAVSGLALLLDNGRIVWVEETADCCARTDINPNSILNHLDQIDHVITGVGTTDGYNKWHIYADLGDVLEFTVDWSCGNPFYYAYGFDITVYEPKQEGLTQMFQELERGE